MLQVATKGASGQCWVMENENTYPDQLAQRVAGLSASHDVPNAKHHNAPVKQPRKRLVSAAVLACVGLIYAGVWSGFQISAASPSADIRAATPDITSLSEGVAASLSAPVLGAGTLLPTKFVVLETMQPLALLALTPGTIIPAESPVFETDPDGVRLPFDAKVLTVDPATRSVSLMQLDAYTLALPVAEAQLHRVTLGDTAEVQFDALPGATFAAVVSAIAPQVTPGRGTVTVSLTLQDPPFILRPNMAARISLCGCPTDLRLSENG